MMMGFEPMTSSTTVQLGALINYHLSYPGRWFQVSIVYLILRPETSVWLKKASISPPHPPTGHWKLSRDLTAKRLEER